MAELFLPIDSSVLHCSANLGAFKLAEQCKTLESIGRNNSAMEDVTLLTRLESELNAVSIVLASLLQEEAP